MTWDPAQYNRFAAEREQPFWDLAALLQPTPSPALVDLGCGDGRLTAELAGRLGARQALGIDSSPAMLAQAAGHQSQTTTFDRGDLASWSAPGTVDVVFSNAALHWVPDHPAVLAGWAASLTPGGQLAVQMPANADHPSHTVSQHLAAELLGAGAPPDPVAANVARPEDYAGLLHDLGFARQHVRLQVYGHLLESTAAVGEWVKGSSLTRFKDVLGPDGFDAFVAEYTRRLVAEIGDQRPYFYTFKRVLLWGLRAP